jgi:beta-glucanase (GH16 family)
MCLNGTLPEAVAMKASHFRRTRILVLLGPLFLLNAHAQKPAVSAPDRAWTLTWSDEFNGPNGSSPDASKWVFEQGGKGWGNNELESYTDRPRNAHLQDGNLAIQAIAEKYKGSDGISRDYTSARIKTKGKFSQAYGRFEARIRIPYGQGLWPAFWMLGDDLDEVGWPRCGEIDIMENIGKEPSVVHGSIHGPGYTQDIEAHYAAPNKQKFADDFHVYAVEWEADAIRFYVDQDLYVTRTHADLRAGQVWEFDHPFYLLLNVAVGGDWPGNPNASTVFPQTMLVDYVRVYRRAGE